MLYKMIEISMPICKMTIIRSLNNYNYFLKNNQNNDLEKMSFVINKNILVNQFLDFLQFFLNDAHTST